VKITFIPLTESHFPLLLEWLETPHVKSWWDQDVRWTLASIQEKYSDYVKGYKRDNGISKPIEAYIICTEDKPIGYVQIYNAYDFPRSKPLFGLPKNLGAFDIFIGNEKYLGQNIGSKAIKKFFSLYGHQYAHIFVDPDSDNLAAIKCYEKAGFRRLLEQKNTGEVWMLWENKKPASALTKSLTFSDMPDSNFDDKIAKALCRECKKLIDIKSDFERLSVYLRKGGHTVAGTICYIHGKILWCDSIYVEEAFQNMRLGSQLISKLLEIAIARNLREIQLNTYFQKSYVFFRKCGFEEIAVIPNWKYDLTCYLMRKIV
jgi:ribosomal protein S18 acetylase RimI-like enzyme